MCSVHAQTLMHLPFVPGKRLQHLVPGVRPITPICNCPKDVGLRNPLDFPLWRSPGHKIGFPPSLRSSKPAPLGKPNSLTSRKTCRFDFPFSHNEKVAALSKCHESAPGATALFNLQYAVGSNAMVAPLPSTLSAFQIFEQLVVCAAHFPADGRFSCHGVQHPRLFAFFFLFF